MGIKGLANISKVTKEFEKTVRLAIDDRIADILAQEAVAIIQERTADGLDVNRKPFRRYSTKKMYVSTNSKYNPQRMAPRGGVLTKSKKSRRYNQGYREYHQSIQSDGKVTLSNTGQMVKSIWYRRNGKNRDIIILETGNAKSASNNTIANAHVNGEGDLPKRDFFGLKHKRDTDRLMALWKSLADKVVKR